MNALSNPIQPNIWHILAEKALAGNFQPNTGRETVSYALRLIESAARPRARKLMYFLEICQNGPMHFYLMTPEEQCLFLLFCGESFQGESYES